MRRGRGSDGSRLGSPARDRGVGPTAPASRGRGSDGPTSVRGSGSRSEPLVTGRRRPSVCRRRLAAATRGSGPCREAHAARPCWRNLGETLESPRSLAARCVRTRGWEIRLCGRSRSRRRAAAPGRPPGPPGPAAVRLPGAQPRPRVHALRADRPAVARASAGGRRVGAVSALLSKLRRRARRRRAAGPRRAAAGARRSRRGGRRAWPRRRWRAPRPRSSAGDWAAAAAYGREALGVDGAAFLPDCEGPWVARAPPRARRRAAAGARGVAEAGLRSGGARARRGRAGRARAAIADGAVPRVRAPAADGDPRGGRQPGRGAARVRRPAPAAARRARHDARPGRDGGPRAPAARRAAGARPPARARDGSPRCRGRAPLGAADRAPRVRRARRGARRAARAAGAQRAAGAAPARPAGRRRRASARRAWPPSSPPARTTRARVVLYGRFDEEALAPYQPLVEMLRGWAGGASLEPLRERARRRARPSSASLLPEFGAAAPAELAVACAARARRRSACASSTRSRRSSARSAGARRSSSCSTTSTGPTARRCCSCATSLRAPRRARGCCSSAPTARPSSTRRHPLRELVADLRREGSAAARSTLGGLDAPRGRRARRARSAARPDARRSSRALHGETEGNPFFIEEVVRHLPSAGELDAERPRWRRRRARGRARGRRAPPAAARATPCREALGRRRGDRPRVRLRRARERRRGPRATRSSRALEEAIEARVVREGGRVGRYQFAHALIRATLYDSVSRPAPRAAARAHRGGDPRAAAAPTLDPHLAALAHHFRRPRRSSEPERAVDFALAAARRADRLLAWEEAAGHYRARAEARELAADRRRARALRAAARARRVAGARRARHRAGDVRRGRRDGARRLGDPVLLGRAALGFAGPWSMLGRADEERVARARGGAGGARRRGPPAARPPARPARARALLRRRRRSGGSRSARRRSRSPGGSATPPRSRCASTRATTPCGARRRSSSGWRSPPSCGGSPSRPAIPSSSSRAPRGRSSTCSSSATCAAPTSSSRRREASPPGCTGRCTSGGRRSCAPRAPSSTGASRRPRRSPRTRSRSASAARRRTPCTTSRWRSSTSVASRGGWRRSRRRSRASSRSTRRSPRGAARWRCSTSSWGARRPPPRRSRAVAEPGFDALPRDANWLIAVTLLAEVCGAMGDGDRARELYALLEPYAGRNVVVGRAATCNGSASRLLGILAGDAARVGAGRAPLRGRARHARGDGRAPVDGAHAARVGGDAARARSRRRRRAGPGAPAAARSSWRRRSGWSRWPSGRGR